MKWWRVGATDPSSIRTVPGAPKTMKNKGFHLQKTWFLGTKNKVFDGFGCSLRCPAIVAIAPGRSSSDVSIAQTSTIWGPKQGLRVHHFSQVLAFLFAFHSSQLYAFAFQAPTFNSFQTNWSAWQTSFVKAKRFFDGFREFIYLPKL